MKESSVAFADSAASGVCLAPSCFLFAFCAAGFLEEDLGAVSELDSGESDEVAEDGSEAEDMDAEGFLESPLIVADESDGAWTSAGGAVVLEWSSVIVVNAGAAESESESDPADDADEDDEEEEATTLLPDTRAALGGFSEARAFPTLTADFSRRTEF